MYTKFLGTENYKGLSASYIYDNQVDFANNKVFIDGNLTTSFTPILSNLSDIKKNNYSSIFLTKPIKFSPITDFTKIQPVDYTYTGLLSCEGLNNWFLSFTDNVDQRVQVYKIFDTIFNGRLSAIGDLNFFEINISDPYLATISHLYNETRYFLYYNAATQNINMLDEKAFTQATDYTRKFYYTFDEKNNTLTFQVRINSESFTLIGNPTTRRLQLSSTSEVKFTSPSKRFKLTTFLEPSYPEISNDWISYQKTFNINDLNINSNRSLFDIKNNFLLHSEYYNVQDGYIPSNIISLKNQLDTKNSQGRSAISEEGVVNFRNYENIFSGGKQEKGHEKLTLGFTSYTTPYIFKQGQTTYFHTPQDISPYLKLNIKSSSLIDSGAIAGDHPLRSDKVWKKIANYKYTSNQGTVDEEQTGQWLCSWLSGAPNINTRPVWVDRYFNPLTDTEYTALSAERASVTYLPSFECYNLQQGIVDVPSSLTFEPGCLYAYCHIGRNDAEQNILSWDNVKKSYNLSNYYLFNYQPLDPIKEDETDTYIFNGSRFGIINMDNISYPQNVFSFSFWASREDWTIPCGFEIAGNFLDYGLGIFNYNFVTPILFYLNGGKLVSVNDNLEVLNTFDSSISAFGNIRFLLRRDPLNSFHVITDTQQLIEFDLKETITDATSSLSAGAGVTIKHASNDERFGYVLYSNNTVRRVDLVSNVASNTGYDFNVGTVANSKEVIRVNNGTIGIVDGTQCTYRNDFLYFLSAGRVGVYDTKFRIFSGAYTGRPGDRYTCFNIDRFNNVWIGSANKIEIYGQYSKLLSTITLSALSSFTTSPAVVHDISFIENFKNGELIYSSIIAASGSQANKNILFNVDYNGAINNTVIIDAISGIPVNFDPSNNSYNYSYLKASNPTNSYTFKARLYNQFNTEDTQIPQIVLSASDLNPGWHHFVVVVNSPEGQMNLYVDGELYGQALFSKNKFNYVPIISEDIVVGSSPFYGGLTLSDNINRRTLNNDYFVKDLKVQRLYSFAKALDYFDVGMLYKQKNIPNDLVFNIPSGKRTYLDTANRHFTFNIPGAKSSCINIFINDFLLTNENRDYVESLILNQINNYLPGYVRVNSIIWNTNTQSQSGTYYNTFINGGTFIGGSI